MVYFIRADSRVKIGLANDPLKRITEIQTSCPFQIEVLLVLDGGYMRERSLHKQFEAYRRSGEWFEFAEPLQRFIANNMTHDRRYECGFVESDFGGNQQILGIRSRLCLPMREVAKRLGVTIQTINDYEESEERGGISVNTLRRVGRALGYKLEYRFVPTKENSDETL